MKLLLAAWNRWVGAASVLILLASAVSAQVAPHEPHTTTPIGRAQPREPGVGAEASPSGSAGTKRAFPSPFVDERGVISLPTNHRREWTHLGSWAVDDPEGDRGMHDVYAQPEAVAAFLETGRWPDGAVIVKEVRGGHESKLSTGVARRSAGVKVWFVMVKDSQGSFPNHPNWGRGWGWALFEREDPSKNASTDYKLDCLACHTPARETDWVYQQGYPVLSEGRSGRGGEPTREPRTTTGDNPPVE